MVWRDGVNREIQSGRRIAAPKYNEKAGPATLAGRWVDAILSRQSDRGIARIRFGLLKGPSFHLCAQGSGGQQPGSGLAQQSSGQNEKPQQPILGSGLGQ